MLHPLPDEGVIYHDAYPDNRGLQYLLQSLQDLQVHLFPEVPEIFSLLWSPHWQSDTLSHPRPAIPQFQYPGHP